ncbi:MAG: DUF4397 domain-containing protein [Bacteroidetes bacterium]|nr:DUF4397 domain-containing protein [Bacteroidota bacterium]
MTLSSLRRALMAVLSIAATGLLLSSCLKNNDNNNTPETPVAGLMGFNLASDQSSVQMSISGNSLSQSPLGYTAYTGGYLTIYTGSRTIESVNTQSGNTTLASTMGNFEQNKYYSVFLLGYNNHYRHVIATDNYDSLSTTGGSAYVRYINAIADTAAQPSVTITAGGNSVVNENALFGTVSAFKAVSPGNIGIAVKSGAAIDTSRTITVEQNKVYTVLLTGVPGATDDAKKVQIKYVQNGALSGTGN